MMMALLLLLFLLLSLLLLFLAHKSPVIIIRMSVINFENTGPHVLVNKMVRYGLDYTHNN